ncbi:hypothetical protein [Bradyrhizobium ganzhouense]|uniref:hypothetical protein n=1 Tax=Bradyrhizobium ganzhouense TaxID=1179767 RepID=UPI003CFA3DC5
MAQSKRGRELPKSSEEKRSFFATLSADVIKAMKQAALEDDTTASELFEQAAREWLDRRSKR